MRNVLIIKLGYSETLTSEIDGVCSLGDVFRTTVILHLFSGDKVAWLTDRAALPLLEGNKYIDRVVAWDDSRRDELLAESFDVIINLEKAPDVCRRLEQTSTRQYFGFRNENLEDLAAELENGQALLQLAFAEDAKRTNNKCWDELVYQMLGEKWRGQSYFLGYRPKTKPEFDVGFNIHVGPKFPVKKWPEERWQALESLLAGGYSVSYQQHLNDLRSYLDWLNTVRVLVTNDSLGMYLGIALGKHVITLIGPTSGAEIAPHPRMHILTPRIPLDCMPCGGKTCEHDDPCIRRITPEDVYKTIRSCIKGSIKQAYNGTTAGYVPA